MTEYQALGPDEIFRECCERRDHDKRALFGNGKRLCGYCYGVAMGYIHEQA